MAKVTHSGPRSADRSSISSGSIGRQHCRRSRLHQPFDRRRTRPRRNQLDVRRRALRPLPHGQTQKSQNLHVKISELARLPSFCCFTTLVKPEMINSFSAFLAFSLATLLSQPFLGCLFHFRFLSLCYVSCRCRFSTLPLFEGIMIFIR